MGKVTSSQNSRKETSGDEQDLEIHLEMINNKLADILFMKEKFESLLGMKAVVENIGLSV